MPARFAAVTMLCQAVVGLVTYGNRLRLLRNSGDKSWAAKLWGALRGKGA
jgi:hypothetical protein